MDTVRSAITEPVRRLDVFTGAGRRRKWSEEDKARIVAEIVASGDSVCAVARPHGLSPQQLFGWRRQLRESAARHSETEELRFVPAVVDVVGNICESGDVFAHARSLPRPQVESTIDAFLDAVAGERRREDCRTIVELMRKAPGAEPKMWGPSIVGFGRYRYEYSSGRTGDWPVVGFSPRKSDLTLYVIIPGADWYEELLAKLGKHKTGKSCLYLKRLAGVDMAVLEQIVTRTVAAMAPKRAARLATARGSVSSTSRPR